VSGINGSFTLNDFHLSILYQVVLSEHLDKTLEAAGFICDNGITRNTMVIADKKASCPPIRDPSSPLPSSTHLLDDEEETRPLLRKPSPYKNETSNEPSISGSISYPVKRGTKIFNMSFSQTSSNFKLIKFLKEIYFNFIFCLDDR